MLNRCYLRAISTLGIVAATTLTAFAREQTNPIEVYHDGSRILLTPQATGTHRMAKFGPWELGERLNDSKLREKRLNLYVVFPGGQYRSLRHRRFNHTLVVNKYAVNGKPREWDIFWCLVLDPSLRKDLRSERELLVAANQRFRPKDDFKVQRIPSHAVMADELRVNSVDDLRSFRSRDGSLPRVLILPAHMAVRAIPTRK